MRKLMGHVGVDSGQIIIVDPASIRDDFGAGFTSKTNIHFPAGPYLIRGEGWPLSYAGCCAATCSPEGFGSVGRLLPEAVAMIAGPGDGRYPIYGEFSPQGCLLRVTVDFTEDDADERGETQ